MQNNGKDATGYGCGGSGAQAGSAGTNYAGGSGGAGVIIIEEYY